ncbi:MAG: peroxiredoxin [Pseudomonadota bacterium]|nr:peroxiredoxin [Pseudomonadota bacterium]
MVIRQGDTLPAVTLRELTADGPREVPLADLLRGRRVVLFGVPGAFTPTCSARHLPGYLELAGKLRLRQVDEIVCIAVNDLYVTGAWAKEMKTEGTIRMLADGNGDFARAIGLEDDLRKYGMGLRSRRYSMLVDDGIVREINVEAPGKFEVSDAETMIYQLDRLR